MGDDIGRSEIIECEIRLHTGPPVSDSPPNEWSGSDWSETAVGDPLTFRAIANPLAGTWNGPLSPGADVSSPVALDDPWWTVRLPGSSGVPIMCGQVGGALAVGEAFTLPAGEPGVWTAGIVFNGSILTD